MLRKRVLVFLCSLNSAVVSSGVMMDSAFSASHSLSASGDLSKDSSFLIREDKDLSIPPFRYHFKPNEPK